MRLLHSLLLAGAAVLALPSPQPNLIPRFPTTPINDMTLTQPPDSTSPVTADPNTLCYIGIYARPVTRRSCSALVGYVSSRRDFQFPKRWFVGSYEAVWELQGCRLTIVNGRWDDIFSLQDVVLAMERVLETCQPPTYMGVGGTAPVKGLPGFMYGAFPAQVTAAGD